MFTDVSPYCFENQIIQHMWIIVKLRLWLNLRVALLPSCPTMRTVMVNFVPQVDETMVTSYLAKYQSECHCKGIYLYRYWSIVDLKYHISYMCIALHYMCVAWWFCMFTDYTPLKAITGPWLWFPVLYSTSLLLLYFIHSILCLLLPYP